MAADRSKVFQQAQLFASRGQYDAAIAEWKKLAMEAPGDGSIHNSIGDLHLKRNVPADAITAFLQAAAAFRAEGATLKAIAAYKKVLKIDPTRYEVYRHLGDLNAERGLLSSAVQDYLTLGKYYLKERKGKEALEIYKKIVTQDPSNLDAQQRVAELCVQENLQDEATKVYLQLGRERSAQGRYDEAKDAYLAALRIDPKNSEAAQFVASVQKSGTGSIKAVKPGPSAPAQKLSEPLDLFAEATRRIEEKQYAGAEAILNQMLTREPGNPQVCQLLARLHLQRGDVQVALGEYRFLAGAALRAQDYALAETLIGEFLSAEPNSVPLLELYGELYEEKGDGTAAARQYARAVELLMEHPEPGMESLHEELFEKVKSLSTDAAFVSRLAARIAGEPPAESGAVADREPSPIPVAEKAPVEVASPVVVNGFSISGAEPDDPRTTPPKKRPEQDRQFSLEGAEPDGLSPFEKKAPVQAGGFSLANAEPDGDGIRSRVTARPEAVPDQIEVPVDLVVEPECVAGSSGQIQEVEAPASDDQREAVEEPVSAMPDRAAGAAPDYEAHFTLGVAYKNMGLYPEAKEEFEVSKTGDAFYLDSCLMTALCHKEERQLVQAIRGLEAVLADPRCQGAKGQAIRYELGLMYEAEAQWDKAAVTFQSIPSFHDVPQRLESLKGRHQPTQAEFRLAG
ncbi:MAG TPA: tetratricopeptide repeat protein [Nitrospiraceae bacterium]|nr:tetratricopeptide repeat protein [Nitrospiraceae bacterium]